MPTRALEIFQPECQVVKGLKKNLDVKDEKDLTVAILFEE